MGADLSEAVAAVGSDLRRNTTHMLTAVRRPDRRPVVLFYLIGAGLLLLCGAIAVLSPAFEYGTLARDHPVSLFICLYSGAGLITLPLVWIIPQMKETRRSLLVLFAIGAVARLVFLPSTPIYEDDFYRYLWDGAVTANGIDPFKYPPSEFLQEDDRLAALLGPKNQDTSEELETLKRIAVESGTVIHRINYPYIKTEYPLVAQAAFAMSYWIAPWSLLAWKIICLICEAMTLFLLLRLLDVTGRSPLWSALYWWNPIPIIEIANRVHMEALLVPALVAVAYFAVRHKPLSASAALAAAVGIKFWPALFVPVVLGYLSRDMKTALLPAAVFVCGCALILLPQIPHGLEANSGLITYSNSWQTNSFAFTQLSSIFGVLGIPDADLAARLFVFVVVSGLALVLSLGDTQSDVDLVGRLTVIAAALFLLSPTQYPWYVLWFLPFLIVVPIWPLLLISVTIPLYFSRYYFLEAERSDIFNTVFVPLQFLPIFLALAVWGWMRHTQPSRTLHAA